MKRLDNTSQRIAEILIPESIDRKGRPSRIATAYGPKTRAGLAELIDSETAAPDMAKALERLLACPDLNLGNLEDESCEAMAEAKAALAKAGYEFP